MPSLPSSFASAAAGQTRDSRGGRSDSSRGAGSGDGPRTNGTRTFRRQSTTPFNQTASASAADAVQNSNLDVQPQPAKPLPSVSSFQYSKDDLLDIYKQHRNDESHISPEDLFMPGWSPKQANGGQPRTWGKTSESTHVPQDPTVCWELSGTVRPIGLENMTLAEREMFATDVNSTLKPPQQQPKDGGHQGNGGVNGGRKTSVSVGAGAGGYPLSSPSTATRPGTRRRETGDTNPFPSSATVASPTSARFSRDDPWIPRRNTELRETITDEPEEDPTAQDPPARTQPFGLGRGGAAPSPVASSGFGGHGALWGPGSGASAGPIGAFGSFALTSATIGDKRFVSGGSRLAHLIPKDSSDNIGAKASEPTSADTSRTWRPRQRNDMDPFAGDDGATGSAALGGAQDQSPPPNTSQAQRGSGSVFDTPVKGAAGDYGMAGLSLAGREGNRSASPSETNPYRSPLAERGEEGQDEHDVDRQNQGGQAASEQPSGYNTLPRSFGGGNFDGSDRSQTSSVGAKGFGSVSHLTGWPSGPAVGTPDRERQPFQSAFGGSIFAPLGELPSPGVGPLGGMFAAPMPSRLGRGASNLESIFAPMQPQMYGQAQDPDGLGDSVPDLRQTKPLGAIGRGAIGVPSRDTGSPVRAGRPGLDEYFGASDGTRSPFSSAEGGISSLTVTAGAAGQAFSSASGQSFTAGVGLPFSSTPSAADPSVRIMVMPDRMRWVYLDPQGVVQGPFSGLEMNDWYKGQFFTPDLRVKRIEDLDFEPLGQLIRRIGNSREPFLVPQMGIPHGPPPSQTGFVGGPSEAVPPLQNAFPSFGRTLTAQQQNDLERRKQEEQLYNARQREFAHHQGHPGFGRLPMQPGVPGSLHHHSSVHSLQSQPSFGSMNSPLGSHPPIGPLASGTSFFDSTPALAPGAPSQPPIGAPADAFAPDLHPGERQLLANIHASGGLPGTFHVQPVGAPSADSSALRSQLPAADQLQKDPQGFSARLQQFQELRAQPDAEDTVASAIVAAAAAATAAATAQAEAREETLLAEEPVSASQQKKAESTPAKKAAAAAAAELSLTEKVRKTQADHAKTAQQPPVSTMPMPFPPPLQPTPLAAPTAQRPASNLPSRYGESRSASGTPDTTSDGAPLAPPPTAPWAPQPGAEAHKGPSLKEIQEAEAKKAAKREEAAAAARRAAAEQEAAALREREKAAAANVGLPPTSTWGTGSPVGAAPSAGSPWKQPAAKTSTPGTNAGQSGSKKTLAEIQREEEARKQKAKEAALQSSVASGAPLGKRYADLAGKGSVPPGLGSASATPSPQLGGGGWSTVGAGGKVKIPTAPAAQTRSVSAAAIKPSPTPISTKTTGKAPSAVSKSDAKSLAMEEFKKWLNRELERGLIGVSDIDQFAAALMVMPLDSAILAEAVYSHSETMDGRHFAEEFVRRKKLADKGVVEKEPMSAGESKNGGNGGWSEVAKKGGSSAAKEEPSVPGFRVVPSKKNRNKK